jgi:hypothetical protein
MSDSSLRHLNTPFKSSIFLSLLFLSLLPLVYSTVLIWQEYVRLIVVVVGLGIFWKWHYRIDGSGIRQFNTPALIALVLIFVTTQFDPSTSARVEFIPTEALNPAFLISLCLSVVAFVGVLFSRIYWRAFDLLDGAVLGTLILMLVVLAGSHVLFETSFPWYQVAKFIIYALLWLTATRWLPAEPVLERRLLGILLGVFVLVCLVGLVRIGQAFYHYQAGQWAQESGEVQAAITHVEDTVEMSRLLNLDTLGDAAVFKKAEILFEQGDTIGAAQTLSMENGFVVSMPSESWQGPSGGMLYTNISCWQNLTLYDGRAKIKIFARGIPALDVWPLMRVKLGNTIVGEIEVDSRETKPYTFDVSLVRGRQRLEVSFINDYFEPPENRDLWVEQAKIQYVEIAWR